MSSLRKSHRWLSLAALFAAACSSAPPPSAETAKAGDGDGDGIPDATDECVTEAEDGKAPLPQDGCKADPNDTDGDGVGKRDQCPTELENANGYKDDDGCPDALPTDTKDVVQIAKDELKCCAKVMFATGKATLSAASQPLLEHVAKTLQDNPAVELVEISGHADAAGTAAHNLDLTKKRAEAVAAALVTLGIDAKRLKAEGYGSYCPVAEGTDAESRELNRRVEFKIVRQGGKETGVELGCGASQAKGLGTKGTAKPTDTGPST
jgi:outer membrane protein OmpA-like peptidoglycan-associated protein